MYYIFMSNGAKVAGAGGAGAPHYGWEAPFYYSNDSKKYAWKIFCFFILVSNFDNYSNYSKSTGISPSLVRIGLKTKKLDAS